MTSWVPILCILGVLLSPALFFIVRVIRSSEQPDVSFMTAPTLYQKPQSSGYDASFSTSLHPTNPVHGQHLPNAGKAPKVAYKRAFLLASSHDEKRYFAGVANIKGTNYAPDADAKPGSPGFHAYERFADAATHVQKGNVILEVLLSGNIEEHKLGYIAQHQRVLQIIFDQCALCKDAATHFAHHPMFDKVVFFCAEHYEKSTEMLENGEIETDATFRPVMGRVHDLHLALPWIAEHNIVLAPKTGAGKFIPTVLSSR